jgi:hypothetical protein
MADVIYAHCALRAAGGHGSVAADARRECPPDAGDRFRRVARELVSELKEYADQIVAPPSEAAHILYDGALLVHSMPARSSGLARR